MSLNHERFIRKQSIKYANQFFLSSSTYQWKKKRIRKNLERTSIKCGATVCRRFSSMCVIGLVENLCWIGFYVRARVLNTKEQVGKKPNEKYTVCDSRWKNMWVRFDIHAKLCFLHSACCARCSMSWKDTIKVVRIEIVTWRVVWIVNKPNQRQYLHNGWSSINNDWTVGKRRRRWCWIFYHFPVDYVYFVNHHRHTCVL